jgi:molecular chaperone DnaK
MPDERRRDPRIDVELNLRLAFGSVEEFIERWALNISRGGIFVRTLGARPSGTVVSLNIELENGLQVLRGQGVVRWSTTPSAPGEPPRDPGMGIKFTRLEPESREIIERMIAGRGGAAMEEEPPAPPEAAPGVGEPPAEVSVARVPPVAPPAEPPVRPAGAPPRPAEPRAGEGSAHPTPPAARRAGRGPTVGIDLGTTNSCVAIARGGRAEVLVSRRGYRTIPSVVAFDLQGRLLVGHAAKSQMIVNPRDTVYGAKRLVGRPFHSPTVQSCRDRFHYQIVEGPGGEAAVRFAGREFTLRQVQAFILRELQEMASQTLGEPVERAVVTVPAYYGDAQRQAVRDAGELAGLEVVRIVNEPTAAALAFGFGKALERRVLVYDLGGGTFDASLLDVNGDVYEVLSTGGDTFLGGVDFDSQLMDHLVWRFVERHGFAPPRDPVVWQRIRDAAEEAKISLSGRDLALTHVPYLCKDPRGGDLELKVEVSRALLEELTEALVDRTVSVTREVIAAASLSSADVDDVLLVGGQSRMPLVWRKIREALGHEPNKGVHPDEAVALGAALLAESDERVDSVVLIDVLPVAIGVGLPGGRVAPVFPRNTRLPARKAYELATSHEDQETIELVVFQGDSPRAAECEYLGTVRVEHIPRGPRGSVRVALDFHLGHEGILGVRARNLATGELTRADLRMIETPESLKAKLAPEEGPPAPAAGVAPLLAGLPAPADGGAPPEGSAGGRARRGILGRIFGRR